MYFIKNENGIKCYLARHINNNNVMVNTSIYLIITIKQKQKQLKTKRYIERRINKNN